MLTSLIASALIFDAKPLSCAVMNDDKATKIAMEYVGAKYSFCCNACPTAFQKEPTKFAHSDTATVAEFLFDPVTGEYVDRAKSKLTMDYKGIRYSFNSDEDLTTFTKDPAKFTKVPSKEILQCPMSNEKLTSYSQAYGYMDYNDTRYYICCNHCFPKAKADPEAAAKNEKGSATTPMAMKWADAKPEIH